MNKERRDDSHSLRVQLRLHPPKPKRSIPSHDADEVGTVSTPPSVVLLKISDEAVSVGEGFGAPAEARDDQVLLTVTQLANSEKVWVRGFLDCHTIGKL